jgi:hypothetical protein
MMTIIRSVEHKHTITVAALEFEAKEANERFNEVGL